MTSLRVKPLIVLSSLLLAACLLPIVLSTPAIAADAAKPQPDVLVFANGENLIGKLDHAADGKVFFKSENAGMVTVPWAKLKQLRTESPFAVIETGVPVGRKKANLDVPVGTLVVEGDTLRVTTGHGTQKVPVKIIAYLVSRPEFEKSVLNGQGLLQGVTGAVTAGLSTVNSTQNSLSVNTAVSLVRAVPLVSWMPPRQRTLLDFNSNYGRITAPDSPTVKTNILHGGLEQDEYLSPRLYFLQRALFDHNFSQGLDLQQFYGIGAGYTLIKTLRQELDATATVGYTKQQFAASGSLLNVPPDFVAAYSTNLVSSSFGDNYIRRFNKKVVFTETAVFNPAWNHPSDYSANIALGATFALYKNLGFSLGLIDSYLNNPPTGFKGNSVQFNTGLTYTISR